MSNAPIAVDDMGQRFDIPSVQAFPGGSPAKEFWTGAYEIPADLPAGQYTMLDVLSYKCPHIDEPFDYTQPPIRFTVIDAADG